MVHYIPLDLQQSPHAPLQAFVRLLLLCLSMFLGTALVGLAPTALMLSDSRIVLISTLGAGLLVGAALGVILPEGIEAVYAANNDNQSRTIAYALTAGFAIMFIIDHMLNKDHETSHSAMHAHSEDETGYYLHDDGRGSPVPATPSRGAPARGDSRGEPDSPKTTTPLLKRHRVPTGGEAAARAHSLSTVVGLLVHSLSDGISLGSSTAASESGGTLDLVIFAAILIHKAPAAFGLTTVLLSDGAPKDFIRRAVLLFALAAPAGAVVTYAILRLIGSETLRLQHATGVALVISAGTFLYVSTHIVADQGHAEEKLSKRSHAIAVLCGLALPLLLNAFTEHSH